MICIYRITCLVTGKSYVGSTIDKNPRWRDHKADLRKNKHSSKYLQAAWNKYGADQFEFVIIEKFDEISEGDLRIKEQEYIEKLETHKMGFNCAYPVKQHAPSERMTEAHKAYWDGLDDDKKADRVGHLKTEEQQQRATKGKQTEEHRLDKSIKAKKQWSDPAYNEKRKELSERFKGFHKDPNFWKNRAEKLGAKWQDPEFREKNLPQVESARKKALEAKKAKMNDPEYRAKLMFQMKKMTRRVKFKKLKRIMSSI